MHDPLWLLGRQWQFGEFAAGRRRQRDRRAGQRLRRAAERAAPRAPARARTRNVRRARRAARGARRGRRRPRRADRAERVRAGQHFERLLAARDLSQVRRPPTGPRTRSRRRRRPSPDAAGRRFARARRRPRDRRREALQDLRSRCAATPPALPAAPVIAPADPAAVIAVAQAWLAWFDALVFTPSGGPARWVPGAARVRVRGRGAPDGITLEADEYADGQLDWHTFTATGTTAEPARRALRARPVDRRAHRGHLPRHAASRLWEFEDGRVNFGAVAAEPEDLGRMLLSGFALVYGADWLMVPLEVPVGALVRITQPRRPRHLRAHHDGRPDGARRRVGDVRALARRTGGPKPRCSSRPRSARACRAATSRRCCSCATRSRTSRGRSSARSRARTAARRPAQAADEAASHAAAGATPGRRRCPTACAPIPPPYWFPLMPQRAVASEPVDDVPPRRLPRSARAVRRRRCARGPPPDAAREGPEARAARGRGPARGRTRHPRLPAGALDRRHTYLWLGRRKTVGRGEGSSGLRFDTTEPPT